MWWNVLHRCNDRYAPYSNDLDRDIIGFDVRINRVKSRVQLSSPESKTGANAEEGGEDGKDVDEIADPSEDPISEDRIKTGFHRHRKSFSERDETE